MKTVAITGAGTMGAGIAEVAIQAGWSARIWDAQTGAVKRGLERIGESIRGRVKKGKLDNNLAHDMLARLYPADTLEDSLNGADLYLEAVIEDPAIKRDLITRACAVAAPATILATNTSSLSITALGSAADRPERFVGMHFFNPAPAMRLVEIIRGQRTSDETAKIALGIAREWGKTPALAKDTPGFIVNRVARSYYGEALRMLGENLADHETIDRIMTRVGGFKMGPFQLLDLVGIEVNLAVTESVYRAFFEEPRFRPHPIQRRMVEAGLLGRKTKRGFYLYGD